MANIQIYQLPNKPVLQATDLFGIDDASVGHVTWNVSAQEIATFVNSVSTTSPAQIIYVANSGNDTTGSGQISAPYATISHALSTISDNSSTKPYLMYVVTGVYTESSLAVKPWIYIEGNNSKLTVSGSVTLDSSWNSAVGNGLIQNFNISAAGNIVFNFAAGTARASTFVMRNINTGSTPAFNVTGTALEFVVIQSVFNPNGTISPVFQDINGYYEDALFSNFSYTNTRTDTAVSFTLDNIKLTGALAFTSTGNQLLTAYLRSVITQGTITATGIPTNLFLDGASTNVTPTAVGGAVIVNLGKSNNYDANITPANYTPVDSSIHGSLAGIDNKFSTVVLKANNLSDLVNKVTSAQNIGASNLFVNLNTNSDQTLTSPIPITIALNIASSGKFLILPNATTLNPNEVGKQFLVRNMSSVAVGVKDGSGAVISVLAPNSDFFMVNTANGTAAGSWFIDSLVNSVNGFTGNITLTSDNIAEGTSNLYLSTDSGVTTHQPSFNNFVFNSLSAGSNITITQPGGAGTPSLITGTGGSSGSGQTLMVMTAPRLTFPNGFITSVIGTMQGSNLIPANTLVPGDILTMNITGLKSGTVSGGSMVMIAIFIGPVGHIIGQSPSIASTLGGATSTRCWSMMYQVSIISATQFVASAAGWYEDDSHNVKSFQIYTTPAVQTFDPTDQNLIDIQELVTVGGGNTYGFYAYNASLIKYHV